MNLVIKKFDELTSTEVYEILKARTEIFVVEQNCVYQDMDDKDYKSLHIFYEEDKKVIAYLRVFRRTDDIIQIGRVLTLKHGNGLGRKLMEAAIQTVRKQMQGTKIYLESQTYATGYYAKFGFKITSGEFPVDGIPHVSMELQL